MIAYKGFDKNMQCRGYQYKEGEEYTASGDINVCENGFHACDNPLDVFKYYRPDGTNKFYVVDCSGDINRKENEDSKFSCEKIKICAEINIAKMIKIGVKAIIKRAKTGAASGDYSTGAASGYGSTGAASGDYSTGAASGNCSTGAASGGYSTGAASGDYSTGAASGYSSTGAASGYWSTGAASGYGSTGAASGYGSTGAASGYYSTGAASGDCSTGAASGNFSTGAASGDYSTGAASGDYSTGIANGKNSIAVANGNKARAKGAMGNYIVLTEYDNNMNLLCCKTHKVDGKTIKPDTLYMLSGGKFVPVE